MRHPKMFYALIIGACIGTIVSIVSDLIAHRGLVAFGGDCAFLGGAIAFLRGGWIHDRTLKDDERWFREREAELIEREKQINYIRQMVGRTFRPGQQQDQQKTN